MHGAMIPISFLPTGEIDTNHTSLADFHKANALLAPTASYMASITKNTAFDLWKLINWVFVSYYWIFLADLGQTATTVYPQALNYDNSVQYSSENNIFVNETLFEIYSSYLKESILPLLRLMRPGLTLPEFLPLDDNNRLQPIDISLLRSYSCLERQLKGWASATISILVADYALIAGPYKLFIFVAGWLQRRRHNRNLFNGFTKE